MFPYLPEGREILYVDSANKFMKEAAELLKSSGCVKQPTAAVVVKNGKIIGRGANAGKKIDVCPRAILKCPTGEGYELCKSVCEQEGHAEVMAINDALAKGEDLAGADMYLDGHWWVCKPCWDEIIRAGIKNVYLRSDSAELYKR